MTSQPQAVVFLGPTLPVAEARNVADAVYLPPAAQGSVIRAVELYHPHAILIIDGVFQSEPAVRHKEILWALDQGVVVLGAASMGALRAAELHAFGMIGIGLIYRWFRRTNFAPDDAVAVVHGPPELGSPAATLSLVDLLMTIKRAHRRGLLNNEQRLALDRAARSLNFRERTLANVATATGSIDSALLASSLVDQKRQDAVCALQSLAMVNPTAKHGPRHFTWTTAFVRDLEHAGITLPPSVIPAKAGTP
jgi:hypothetical protein